MSARDAEISANSNGNRRKIRTMALEGPQNKRLDSWKEIADYLGRGVATVRRWERALGLPVRRLPGSRRSSVFAYTGDIDAWLKSTPRPPELDDVPVDDATRRRTLDGRPAFDRRVIPLLAGVAAVVIAAVLWRTGARNLEAQDLRVAVLPDGVVASDARGVQRWRYDFAREYRWEPAASDLGAATRVMTGANPEILVETGFRQRRSDDVVESGELLSFDLTGALRRSFSFSDRIVFHGGSYGPPWILTSFSVSDSSSGRRVAVAAHHHTWNPGLVTVLDDEWQRRGTFVHNGWVESVRWLSSQRLLVSGFSNTQNGGMVALLDPSGQNGVEGQGPEEPNAAGYCERCGSLRPVRMVILPRSPLNLATGSPFNRALLEVAPDRIIVRTREVPPEPGATWVEAIYAFTPSLDLVDASFGERYRDVERALIAQGRLRTIPAGSSERSGPQQIRVWQPDTGWKEETIR